MSSSSVWVSVPPNKRELELAYLNALRIWFAKVWLYIALATLILVLGLCKSHPVSAPNLHGNTSGIVKIESGKPDHNIGK